MRHVMQDVSAQIKRFTLHEKSNIIIIIACMHKYKIIYLQKTGFEERIDENSSY